MTLGLVLAILGRFSLEFRTELFPWLGQTVMFNLGFNLIFLKFFVSHLPSYLFKEIERRFCNSLLDILEQFSLLLVTNNATASEHKRRSDFIITAFAYFLSEGNFMGFFLIVEALDGNLL